MAKKTRGTGRGRYRAAFPRGRIKILETSQPSQQREAKVKVSEPNKHALLKVVQGRELITTEKYLISAKLDRCELQSQC